jgi:hypothetical protein
MAQNAPVAIESIAFHGHLVPGSAGFFLIFDRLEPAGTLRCPFSAVTDQASSALTRLT